MKPIEHRNCMLLGSNIEPEKNLPRYISLLQKCLTVLWTSSVWESQAIGSTIPNILNAAVLALTSIDANCLKEQSIRPQEAQLGQVRTQEKNSPRMIDIDHILFDHQFVDASLWRHTHRAVPVAEVLPEYQSEAGEYLKDANARLARFTPIWTRSDVSINPFSTYFTHLSKMKGG